MSQHVIAFVAALIWDNFKPFMKKIFLRVVLVLVILAVVALAVVFFSLNSIVKKGVETIGPMITKVDVKLGAAEISPFSGSGRLIKFVVGNPEGYKSPSAISVGDVKVAVSPGSLMSGTIVVNELHVQAAEVTLEGTLSGNNLTQLMNNINGSSTSEPKPTNAPPTATSSQSSKKFIVKDLLLEGLKANLILTLPVVGNQSMTIPLPPLHLTNIGTAEGGITAEQLIQKIMGPLLDDVTKAATDAVASMGGQFKDLGKGGASQLTNAVKGLGDFFKKK